MTSHRRRLTPSRWTAKRLNLWGGDPPLSILQHDTFFFLKQDRQGHARKNGGVCREYASKIACSVTAGNHSGIPSNLRRVHVFSVNILPIPLLLLFLDPQVSTTCHLDLFI